MKGYSKVEVTTGVFFCNLEGMRMQIMHRLQLLFKDPRTGKQKDLSQQELVSAIVAHLMEMRVPVERMHTMAIGMHERERATDYIKEIVQKADGPKRITLPAPRSTTAAAHVMHLAHEEHLCDEIPEPEPGYEPASWGPEMDAYETLLQAQAEGQKGICYAFTRGQCNDLRCVYSHADRELSADLNKVGERFLNHQGLQTAGGARAFADGMKETTRLSSLDPGRSAMLHRIAAGTSNLTAAFTHSGGPARLNGIPTLPPSTRPAPRLATPLHVPEREQERRQDGRGSRDSSRAPSPSGGGNPRA